jgi:ubiquinone/menaquinone biosynthesis C-methylase UbiE
VIADIECGLGFYTVALTDCIGNEGKVYAVDSDEKVIKALEKKLEKESKTTSKLMRYLPLTLTS